MRRSAYLLVGVMLIGVLLVVGLGAALAWGTPGVQATSGASGTTSSQSQATCDPGMMGSPGQGGMMGGSQPCPMPSGTPGMGGTQVAIEGSMYHPMMLEVPRGTTVTWTNEDKVAHSVTFRNKMADSGLLQKGQTFRYTFPSAGTYMYSCSVHPYMHGMVTVEP